MPSSWLLAGECLNLGFEIAPAHALRRMSGFLASGWVAMFGLSGDRLTWRIGWRKSANKKDWPIFSLTCIPLSKIMNGMGKKPNPNAQALGSLGGKARARKLSAAERSRIAKLAVAARERERKGGS